ncbi:HAMP domain-containing histidine kinase [Tolypothrix sp. FACHB-123]|uniref:sensor histidine kinase n=1 Tax=Tolypothrix sp. FACHB-123 TaxID=2692868 RepID=UPI001682E285|nr:HAMP domain-containing sensor histidine kinase [Tolypothrix sp. FACHB-123]MBD2356477.1 HAMP domain-containing histidine kinase [Tolypothrix sp. FACHB-123]
MWRLRRSQILGYSIACFSVLVALVLKLLLWKLHRLNSIYPLFLAAVMVSSWYGGFKPGLVATLLSAIVCAYFLLPPLDSLAVSGFSVVGLVQFVLVGLLISSLNSALRQARSQKEQLLRSEQAARAEAEAANRSKDEFLAIVSHELRTPMTAIIGWVGMLQTGMLDNAKADVALETIERNAKLQMQLIEDLLDISRIVRGELSVSFGWVDLAEVITAAVAVVQSLADAKTIQLETIFDDSVNPIWGDSDRLQQVVLNLLTNAIKFTPNGGRVEVRLSQRVGMGEQGSKGAEEQRSKREISNDYWLLPYTQIQVSDTGNGISPDFLPYLFERFCQADSTDTRSNKGLGLGLAIARHVIELHGGTITAQSKGIGKGATFTVRLPFTKIFSIPPCL